jgi:hypothetical protein
VSVFGWAACRCRVELDGAKSNIAMSHQHRGHYVHNVGDLLSIGRSGRSLVHSEYTALISLAKRTFFHICTYESVVSVEVKRE